MSKILISGLVNLETTCKVDMFPVEYSPVEYNFNGISSFPSGVGLNLSLALNTLGDEVKLLSILGNDTEGLMIRGVLKDNDISTSFLHEQGKTASSVILYDSSGKRKIYCDLKDIQDEDYPDDLFFKAMQDCDALVLCNINFSRKFLQSAKDMNKLVATDVHCIEDVDDSYNKDFMKFSDILFMSNENILGHEKEFVKSVYDKYNNKIIVVGMGEKGALLYEGQNDKFTFVESYKNYEVVNTSGAGDALFSSFLHFYLLDYSLVESLEKAVKFAAFKISKNSSSKGFLKENEL